ncbi:ubiquitin carboxyl-terminal hydrolase 45 [Spea bombifrons]|uniref:ubiquitin carboxyl-terminal hydrolase 45 n=1 Tax=Spea bombifrons TaxID=233779 RepID=UPI00234B8E79|nr:ubiquitin carboxyl-terminal hydrolase 45 [Spea bombifrons]
MKVKEPTAWGPPEKSKRSKRTIRQADEDSSDDIVGLTCHHVGQAVDLNHVKKVVSQNVWSVCTECMKERRTVDGEMVAPADVWLCLKCGHQSCGANSECQHSLKHVRMSHSEPHCIGINLSTWVIWCYECDEQLSTRCNKKVLAQVLDFLQKHSSRSEKGFSTKVIRLREENGGNQKGKGIIHNTSILVKGINNLGNTCFFNAVMQNLAQTHMLNEALNEMKEKGTNMNIGQNADIGLEPLEISVSSPGPLTSAVFLFLHSMKEAGREPISPKVLFSQLCQKAPRFKTFQQQDSQELLHYLLDAMRLEETKRIQAGILKAFNNPTTKTADEETKRKVKAYGREGVKMNFIDRIFVGELTSTVMCEECENISAVKEAFIDLSLPIVEERVSKPVLCGRGNKSKSTQEEEANTPCHCNNNQPLRNYSLTKDKVKNHLNDEGQSWKSGSTDDKRNLVIVQETVDNAIIDSRTEDGVLWKLQSVSRGLAPGSQSDGSERDEGSQMESSGDADSEASECENPSVQTGPRRGNHVDEGMDNDFHDSQNDALSGALCKLSLDPETKKNSHCKRDMSDSVTNSMPCPHSKCISQRPQTAFQTLSQGYSASSKECSVQSCLYQFTSVELLMGNNKLLCEKCSENRQKFHKTSNLAEEKIESVYTNARKQLLISAAPANLVLHLKRFYQNGLTLRKINRHVDFPFKLDLAPYCSISCKNALDKSVLYSLYGIVEHSGSMREGHYSAYVKIRFPPRSIGVNKSGTGSSDCTRSASGQWVYVSDTHVQTVSESRVLSSQAYLLFYERLC